MGNILFIITGCLVVYCAFQTTRDDALAYISAYTTIIVGFIMVIAGIFGNININIGGLI